MALKYQLDTPESFEELAEPLKELYKENGGKYTLDVEGVKTTVDFDKVQQALANERKATKALKEQYAPWEAAFQGKTAAEIVAELERIPVLEADATGKIDKTKLDAIVESTVRNRMTPIERERDTLKTTVAERDAVIQKYIEADKRRTIFDAIREVAAKDQVYHEATYATPDGALMVLAEKHLGITEDGTVRVHDESRVLTPGLGVREALAELRAIHPYIAKSSVGGGANGSNIPGGGSNPFKSNNMSARAQFMQQYPDKWQASMKAAGLKEPHQRYMPVEK